MLKAVALGAGVLIVLGTMVAGMATLYVISSHENVTQVLWNERETYIFVSCERTRWKGTYLQFAWQSIRNSLNASTQNVERRPFLFVIILTNGGIQKYAIDGFRGMGYQVFHDRIYTIANDEVVRWSTSGFERVGREDGERFLTDRTLSTSFSLLGGWSSRDMILSTNERQHVVELDGDLAVVATRESDRRFKALDLSNEDGSLLRLWELDEQPKHVSRAEYETALTQ